LNSTSAGNQPGSCTIYFWKISFVYPFPHVLSQIKGYKSKTWSFQEVISFLLFLCPETQNMQQKKGGGSFSKLIFKYRQKPVLLCLAFISVSFVCGLSKLAVTLYRVWHPRLRNTSRYCLSTLRLFRAISWSLIAAADCGGQCFHL